jgi:hypothetical protein
MEIENRNGGMLKQCLPAGKQGGARQGIVCGQRKTIEPDIPETQSQVNPNYPVFKYQKRFFVIY